MGHGDESQGSEWLLRGWLEKTLPPGSSPYIGEDRCSKRSGTTQASDDAHHCWEIQTPLSAASGINVEFEI
jgi:hypothetical protein